MGVFLKFIDSNIFTVMIIWFDLHKIHSPFGYLGEKRKECVVLTNNEKRKERIMLSHHLIWIDQIEESDFSPSDTIIAF